MRPADDIKEKIRQWNDMTSARMDERTLGDIERALAQSQTVDRARDEAILATSHG